MRFVLAFILIFSAAFDVCIASSLFESIAVGAQEDSDCCQIEDKSLAESTEEHESHKHESHDYCQQCHSCQQIVSLRPVQNILSIDISQSETPYQFFIPSTFIKSLKRPPKV